MLSRGDEIDLAIDKPAAGGRMLGRHEGQVVFVQGAIPGERVRVRVDRVERQLAFASMAAVLDASSDRRPGPADPACGGCSYAHVAYPRQLQLKSEIIHDAFARLGRVVLPEPVAVQASPERGYRMRARFHVGGAGPDRIIGFFREGTHEICAARPTGQVRDESVAAVEAAVSTAASFAPVSSAELAENLSCDQRVLHFQAAGGSILTAAALEAAMRAAGLTGCTAFSSSAGGSFTAAGTPFVSDPLPALTLGRAGGGELQRHAASFFQANRYLLPELVVRVIDAVLPQGSVVDLYAGVGLFSVSLASSGRESITAVEGDGRSARDLLANAAPCGAALRVVVDSVEAYVARSPRRADTIVVDPPRTGISRAAMEAVVRMGARRVVYVSCDPPTMARDARRLIDGGYRLTELGAFDLFPNTPHVESVGIFDRV
jgi:23S rRNA (uracil1939-C5)-methyltransferase